MIETNWIWLIDHCLLKCWLIFYVFLVSGENIAVYQLKYGI